MNRLKSITGLILIVLAFIYVLYIPLTNPDITKIRLLIKFWKSYLVICIMLIGGRFLVDYHKK
ncbi:hypothetical protein KTC96_24805 (plasmid) [Clostridium estertheticum]|uniref:hypothetical protein n=1 Tax=Clostridium estertheticum TaxID=238834 RepID=UPI001C7CB109|nr:hypothetical protein [Clostridium estertheticum]MBX4259749.1 hypothetical protein [Clostridium estertheticum]WLC73245.1 hypothetical protein KTC96_24805 [Clostridium estertheticum]